MHRSALENARIFFTTYLPNAAGEKVVEIGAQDLNGSLRQVAASNVSYVGVDFVQGNGVDVVLEDPYQLPFATDSVDVCLSSSVFEHSEMFWLLFLEIIRILKPGGLFYLNVPANGAFHRYPVDCWRFYPDSGKALCNWAQRSGISVAMLESYTSNQNDEYWNDFVAVFVKDASAAAHHPRRILDTKTDFTNGRVLGKEDFVNFTEQPEDVTRLMALSTVLRRLRSSVRGLPAGQAPPPASTTARPASADPWEGCHKVRVLAAPSWEDPSDRWASALPAVCAGVSETDAITVGVVGPSDPARLPANFVAFAEQTGADVVLFPQPDQAGWDRLIAGATAVLLTGSQPALQERARRAGVQVMDGRTLNAPAAPSPSPPASERH